jgi:hypothetical protein
MFFLKKRERDWGRQQEARPTMPVLLQCMSPLMALRGCGTLHTAALLVYQR